MVVDWNAKEEPWKSIGLWWVHSILPKLAAEEAICAVDWHKYSLPTGADVCRWRKLNRLSQRKLAEMAGVSHRTVFAVETETEGAGTRALRKIYAAMLSHDRQA